MRRRVLIVAGDPSGDLHAARLADALKAKAPDLEVTALGGQGLQRVADRFLGSLVGLGVYGFWGPVIRFPALARTLRSVIAPFLTECRPDVVIPVDYYGFNIHVAEYAHRLGIPVVYYISPQVWASRTGRVERLARVVRRMLVIFPFEEAIYQRHGIEVSFVGHPLLDILPEPWEGPRNSGAPVVGLLPGSRPSEVRRHLPIMLQAAVQLRRWRSDLILQLFPSPGWDESTVNGGFPTRFDVQVVREHPHDHQRRLTVALTCSGTATLENALLGVPMAVMYRLSWFNYLIARAVIHTPFIAMPNILANRPLVPELIQGRATATALARAALPLLTDPSRHEALRHQLLALRTLLGTPGASQRAAQEILQLLP